MLRTTLEQVNCPYLILSKNNTMLSLQEFGAGKDSHWKTFNYDGRRGGGGGIRAPRPSPWIHHRHCHRHRHMSSRNESQDYNLTNTIWRIVLGKKNTVVVG